MRKRLLCLCAALVLTALPLQAGPALAQSAEATAAPAADEAEAAATDAESALADAEIDALDKTLSVEQKLKQVFRRYATMGASVAVIENGEITYTFCYGTRRNGGADVTPDTVFQVGSIGKMVSAIGLLQLVEQGKAGLEDELGDLLGFAVRNPAYPEVRVTLRQLMTHTASLRNSGDYNDALAGNIRPLDELLGGDRAQYTFMQGTKPGARREYCNFGGGLIGSLIEKLSGQTLDDYLAQNVFAPLDITAGYQASLLPPDLPVADMYRMPERRIAKELRKDDTHITQPDYLRDYVLTAGKLMISAPDLGKLLVALCDGGVYQNVRILKESTVAEMTTRQDNRGSVTCEAGNGLFLNIITNDQVEGRTMYGHGGKALGMLCAAYFDPTDRTGVVMLTNGCNNRSVHNGVGMLGRAVMRVIYQDLLGGSHEAVDPYLVED